MAERTEGSNAKKLCRVSLFFLGGGMVVLSITLSIPRQDHSSARCCSIGFRREGHCRWSLLRYREAPPPVERAGEGGQVQGGPGEVRYIRTRRSRSSAPFAHVPPPQWWCWQTACVLRKLFFCETYDCKQAHLFLFSGFA